MSNCPMSTPAMSVPTTFPSLNEPIANPADDEAHSQDAGRSPARGGYAARSYRHDRTRSFSLPLTHVDDDIRCQP